MNQNEFADSQILLVEDEETLAIGLEFNLRAEGYQVTWAPDGRKALEFFESGRYDLIVLDIMLPYFDGFQIASRVREKSPQIPILILTARTAAVDRTQGLKLGVDDYLTKPFHLPELLLRIKGMLRRKQWYKEVTAVQSVFHFGENNINFENLTAQAGKNKLELTALEAIFLKYLIENKGRVVSRQELLEKVWQIHSEVETRTVDNFVVRLRKYFEADPAHPEFIKSVRGAGYIFELTK
jgi:DNA-binding response OmpR family regulator